MKTRERYDESFTVLSYEADSCGRLSLFALFNRFQEIAGLHASVLKVGYDELHAANLAWILSRIKLRIHSLPNWGETVELATWPKGIDRLFALREFSLKKSTGEPLVSATSAWLLVDIEKGRPRKIETLPIDLHFPQAEHAIEDSLEKIHIPDGLMPAIEKPVWLSDLDVNQHVNNAQYVKWITDCFSLEQCTHRRIQSVQINYLEETVLGDTVTLMKTPDDDKGSEYFITGVNPKKGSTAFQAQVLWST